MADLIRTINEEDEVENFSEESDVEIEYQPQKRKHQRDKEFDGDFKFVSSVSEYNADAWNDLSKYIKRKGTNKVDEKIEKSREHIQIILSDSEGDNCHSDGVLSDGDLVADGLKEREKMVGKRKKKKKLEMKEEGVCKIEDTLGNEDFFEDAPPMDENSSFYQMNLSRPLMKAIGCLNYSHPTPIQAAAIPIALLGRDICGCAATGTGKTAAYILPILERLLYRPKGYAAITRVLILVPTRELGVQVYQVSKQLAQFTSVEIGLSVGGLELKVQESVLRKNPDVVIATPGRLIDHLKNTPSFSLDDIEVLVLDEADRMLDENFSEQMKEIISMCSRTRQTMLFSATMTDAVKDLMTVSLNKPVKIFVDSNQDVAFNLRQEFVRLRKGKEDDRDAVLAALVCRTFRDHTIVFTRTKSQAHKLLLLLGLLGQKAGELHGNLSQPQRLEALRKFKNEEIDVLIATDVAARGLDISGVKTVINHQMPPTLEHYIHRVGRTARAGKSGVSVSIATEDDWKIVKQIVKKAKKPVKNRVVPAEIVSKYKEKAQACQSELKNILDEEKGERYLHKAEMDLKRSEKILHGSNGTSENDNHSRSWFQTQRQRKMEKLKAKEIFEAKIEGGKPNKKKKTSKKDEEDEKIAERTKRLQKIALVQSKAAKRLQKPKKIRAMDDGYQFNIVKDSKQRKRKATFSDKLADVGRRSVKKARYLGPKNGKFEKNEPKRKTC